MNTGGLPDTIEDDWIDSKEKLEQMMDEYIHLRQKPVMSVMFLKFAINKP